MVAPVLGTFLTMKVNAPSFLFFHYNQGCPFWAALLVSTWGADLTSTLLFLLACAAVFRSLTAIADRLSKIESPITARCVSFMFLRPTWFSSIQSLHVHSDKCELARRVTTMSAMCVQRHDQSHSLSSQFCCPQPTQRVISAALQGREQEGHT
jgi:hypothetical protein